MVRSVKNFSVDLDEIGKRERRVRGLSASLSFMSLRL